MSALCLKSVSSWCFVSFGGNIARAWRILSVVRTVGNLKNSCWQYVRGDSYTRGAPELLWFSCRVIHSVQGWSCAWPVEHVLSFRHWEADSWILAVTVCSVMVVSGTPENVWWWSCSDDVGGGDGYVTMVVWRLCGGGDVSTHVMRHCWLCVYLDMMTGKIVTYQVKPGTCYE